MNPFDVVRHPPLVAGRTVCETCGSRIAGMCKPLDAAVLDDVASDSEHTDLPARGTLFREGDPAKRVYTLIDGVAKLTRLLPDGKQQVVGFRFAGDLLGFTTRNTYPFDAEMLTPSRVCKLERPKLDELLKRHPLLERRFLDLCVQELGSTQEQLVAVGRLPADCRVATFLLLLDNAHRIRGLPLKTLAMPMTRADIADYLGLTLETVSRTFTAFRKRGLIREPGHGQVELLDHEGLQSLAEGDTEH
ncbi:helix-turn-helix domain-containing protein [Acetobacteraceae bacterium H6797]|nr:helix-turn-helix domain-containing protein [Acetobacteraceae bacterium H6797]